MTGNQQQRRRIIKAKTPPPSPRFVVTAPPKKEDEGDSWNHLHPVMTLDEQHEEFLDEARERRMEISAKLRNEQRSNVIQQHRQGAEVATDAVGMENGPPISDNVAEKRTKHAEFDVKSVTTEIHGNKKPRASTENDNPPAKSWWSTTAVCVFVGIVAFAIARTRLQK